MKLYALHDKKAKALSSFHVEKSDVVASRGFVEAVLAKDSQFAKYPQDFELVSLCEVSQDYDGQFGDFKMVSPGKFSDPDSKEHQFVVLTAEQVLASQPQREQLPLKLEA